MKLTKQSAPGSIASNTTNYLLGVNNDLTNIFTAFKGLIRFGTCVNGAKGENINGEFRTFTTHATPDTEFVVTHTLGTTPLGWLVTSINKAGVLYSSTTANTSTSAYFKCSVGSTLITIFLLK